MQITQRDEVDFDLAEISTWYERRQPGLGETFLQEFRRSVDRIADNPLAWPVVRGDVRKYLIREFKVWIVYNALTDLVDILVVVDARRSANLWIGRLVD